MIKYFIYCRKSSEDEERQVLSIEAQLTELREFAKQNGFFIVREYTVSKTAKEPGREIFNQMLSEIEKGNAEGILAWNPFMSTVSYNVGIVRLLSARRLTSLILVFKRLKYPVGKLSFKTSQCPEFGFAFG